MRSVLVTNKYQSPIYGTNKGVRFLPKSSIPIDPSELNLNVWWEANTLSSLFQDSNGTIPVTSAGQPVGRINSLSPGGIDGTATARPLYQIVPSRLVLDKVDDNISFTVPTGGLVGTMVLSTTQGTLAYGVNFPDGTYSFRGEFNPGPDIIGVFIRDGAMNKAEIDFSYSYFESIGGGPGGYDAYQLTSLDRYFMDDWARYLFSHITSFPLINTSSVLTLNSAWYLAQGLTDFPLLNTASVTSMVASWGYCSGLFGFPLIDTSSVIYLDSTWYSCSGLTSFPLIDTSDVTMAFSAWQYCSGLTSFPLLNTSSWEDATRAWAYCSKLANFPANMFDTCPCTLFANAFLNCALTQTSVDNILISIAKAKTSTGTLNITGGTSSAPSSLGIEAIIELQYRNWTVTTNGGIYVSTTGSDTTGTGTSALPYATIGKAASVAVPGSEIVVKSGTYTLPGSIGVITDVSGTSAKYITYRSEVLYGAKLVGTGGDDSFCWQNNGNYTTIIGFDITTNGRVGLLTMGSYTNIYMNRVHDIPCLNHAGNGGGGIDYGNYNESGGNCYNNITWNIGPQTTDNSCHGIYISIPNVKAYNNISYGCSGWGIHAWHNPQAIILVNNLCFDNAHGGIILGGPTEIMDNCIVNNNMCIYNGGFGIRQIDLVGENNVFKNNLCYGNVEGGFYYIPPDQLIDNIESDPLLVNYQTDGSGDYHLTSASPARDAGTSQEAPSMDMEYINRPVLTAFDIGPYEYHG